MKLFKGTSRLNGADPKSIETIIGRDASFEGNILETEGGVCVEGSFKGKILSKGIVLVNQNGKIRGEIIASFVVVHGEVLGDVTANRQLDIGPTGKIKGDVEAASITIVKGGMISGHCTVLSETGFVKELEAPSLLSHLNATAMNDSKDGPSFEAITVEDDIIRPSDSDDYPSEDKEGIIVVSDTPANGKH